MCIIKLYTQKCNKIYDMTNHLKIITLVSRGDVTFVVMFTCNVILYTFLITKHAMVMFYSIHKLLGAFRASNCNNVIHKLLIAFKVPNCYKQTIRMMEASCG